MGQPSFQTILRPPVGRAWRVSEPVAEGSKSSGAGGPGLRGPSDDKKSGACPPSLGWSTRGFAHRTAEGEPIHRAEEAQKPKEAGRQ